MRLEIQSADRIGISQEILAVFAARAWNMRAVEIETCFTYVHVSEPELLFDTVKSSIEQIEGVTSCRIIDLLPGERRAKHLAALLAKVPDAIVDIDEQGRVLAANAAAQHLFSALNDNIVGAKFDELTQKPLLTLLPDKAISTELSLAEQSFIADITPVSNKGKISGAVIVLRTLRNLGRQISLMQARNAQQIDNILGQSEQIIALKTKTLRFAELDMPVLITGETGTGKELFARALHEASPRARAPFLAINCAALPENLLESELFGYAAGAFTGAQRGGKPGLIELANGGTIFLDEIAEMSPYLQAKLLRFLQDFRYRRVGGTKELSADVRVLSATHQNLLARVEQKLFRDDLYYRLNVLALALPPLRQRTEDIAALSECFIANAAMQTNQPTPKLTMEALAALSQYPWPGNIRELQNRLFRLVALLDKPSIDNSDIEHLLLENTAPDSLKVTAVEGQSGSWAEAQAAFERQLLLQLYPLYPTTRKLAQRLRVSHNKIAMKLREHGIG